MTLSAYWSFDGVVAAVIIILCLLVAFFDFRRGIIPDACNAGLAVAGVVRTAADVSISLGDRVLDCAITLAFLLLLRSAYRRYRGHHGLGLGDVKFLAASALIVGMAGLQLVIFFACLAGLSELVIRKFIFAETVKAQTRLRFGPHLAIGLISVLMLQRSGYL
jgi:leader peptidase (prepilin peptidase) / N-methyltransferase